jgi:hypothetical protein
MTPRSSPTRSSAGVELGGWLVAVLLPGAVDQVEEDLLAVVALAVLPPALVGVGDDDVDLLVAPSELGAVVREVGEGPAAVAAVVLEVLEGAAEDLLLDAVPARVLRDVVD